MWEVHYTVLTSTCLVYSLLLEVICVPILAVHAVLRDCSGRQLQVNGTGEPEVGLDPFVRRFPPDVKNTLRTWVSAQ